MRQVTIYGVKKRLTGSGTITETVTPVSAMLAHGKVLHVEVSTMPEGHARDGLRLGSMWMVLVGIV